MMKKISRKAYVFLACAGFVFLIAGAKKAYGASGIDVEKEDCKITFTLDADELHAKDQENLEQTAPSYREYYTELSQALDTQPISVDLYRIADVEIDGKYSLLAAYGEAGTLSGIESADANTTAEEWALWAEAAAQIATSDTPVQTAVIEKDASGKATGAAEGLQTGMYLINVEPVESTGYTYRFVPYLVALPTHYGENGESDAWVYGDGDTPVLVGLKPEREDRYGSLTIEKQLTSYHETLEGATFVFEIRAVKEDRLVYSDVVALNFDAPGKKSLSVEGIPAGAVVTVTEVYSGAGYQTTGSISQEQRIEAEQTIRFSFTNEYNGHLNGGGPGVVNHFVYEKDTEGNDNLTWEKQ